MLDKSLRRIMIQTVQIENFVSLSSYGEPQFSAPVSYACRIEETSEQSFKSSGNERFRPATIYLDRFLSVDTRSRITLPDGSVPFITSVELIYDEAGPYVTILHTGSGAT